MAETHQPTTLQYAATAVTAAVILLPLTLTRIVEIVLRDNTAASTDGQLVPVIVVGWFLLGVSVATAIALIILVQRKHGPARWLWIVLGVQLALGIVLLVLQSALGGGIFG